jgi:hypothetical protein
MDEYGFSRRFIKAAHDMRLGCTSKNCSVYLAQWVHVLDIPRVLELAP